MSGFVCCIKKDICECIRKKKLLIFVAVSFGLALLMFMVSSYIPQILDSFEQIAPELLVGADVITDFVTYVFPPHVRGNMNLFASDMTLYYMTMSVFLCALLIPGEIKKHKWDAPLCKGYKVSDLVFAKAIVYSLASSLPVFVSFIAYYLMIRTKLTDNLTFKGAFVEAGCAFIAVFGTVFIVILLSAIVKHAVLVAAEVAALVFLGADILSLFSFGKFLPTEIIRTVNYVSEPGPLFFVPVIVLFALIALFSAVAVKAPAVKKLRKDGYS